MRCRAVGVVGTVVTVVTVVVWATVAGLATMAPVGATAGRGARCGCPVRRGCGPRTRPSGRSGVPRPDAGEQAQRARRGVVPGGRAVHRRGLLRQRPEGPKPDRDVLRRFLAGCAQSRPRAEHQRAERRFLHHRHFLRGRGLLLHREPRTAPWSRRCPLAPGMSPPVPTRAPAPTSSTAFPAPPRARRTLVPLLAWPWAITTPVARTRL